MFKEFNLEFVQWQTSMRQEIYEKASNMVNDTKRKERLEKQECLFCFYMGSKFGGSAMTDYNCKKCDTKLTSCNTNIDTLCKPCAKTHKVCCHCGADLDLKIRRKI